MRSCRTGFKFWMELASDHKRMTYYLDYLSKLTVWAFTRYPETCFLHPFSVAVVELESMSVPF